MRFSTHGTYSSAQGERASDHNPLLIGLNLDSGMGLSGVTNADTDISHLVDAFATEQAPSSSEVNALDGSS